MAALGAGLKIQHVEEHLEADFDPRGNLLEPEEDGRYRVRVGRRASADALHPGRRQALTAARSALARGGRGRKLAP